MNNLFKTHIQKKEFDHGYLMVGDLGISRKASFEAARVLLCFSATDPTGRLETYPDYFYKKYELFGIDDAKELIYKACQTPLLGDKKVFIIEADSFSIESANALLKTIEEPFSGTHFFIVTMSLDVIIPTLRSRLTIIENNYGGQIFLDEEKKDLYKKFINDLPSKRMETIEIFFKDKQKSIEFLNELEIFLAGKLEKEKIYSISKSLEEIQKNKNLLFMPPASSKMVLEHLALTLPRL
ncbi:hypothetical protein KJ763_01845 [Patescibacteria group bacterium]|nr:hypothetical protein [Patescibacteria group bacterium]